MQQTQNLAELVTGGSPQSAVAAHPAIGNAPDGVELNPVPVPVPTPSVAFQGFPVSAVFTPWTLPEGGRVMPVRQQDIHIGELIGPGETVLLVSINDLSDWVGLKRALTPASELGIETLMLGINASRDFLASAVIGSGDLSAIHGRPYWFGRRTIFVPSADLARVLGVQHTRHAKNAIVLIHQGHVAALWVAPSGTEPHDWADIRAALTRIQQDTPREELELDA